MEAAVTDLSPLSPICHRCGDSLTFDEIDLLSVLSPSHRFLDKWIISGGEGRQFYK